MSAVDGSRRVRWFVMFGVMPLLFIAGVQLFVLSGQTATFFAWTITPPLTAAFMGAGYWGALFGAYTSLRQKQLGSSSTALPPAFAATTMLGIATFLHLAKFHLASPELLTRFVTWVWIFVYVVTPPIFLVGFIAQLRAPKSGSAATVRPDLLRIALLSLGVLSTLTGLLLFVVPAVVSPIWPWVLTPLTARAVGAWMTTLGVACIAMYTDPDFGNSVGTAASVLAFSILELIVVSLYFSTVDWSKPLAWFFVAFLLAAGVISAAGLRRARAQT